VLFLKGVLESTGLEIEGWERIMPYRIEIEIFEGKGGELKKSKGRVIYPRNFETLGICAWMYRGDGEKSYQVGKKFLYPDDMGKVCPWLLSSMDSVIQVLRSGGTLGWLYEGTAYEKVINKNGVTTEYVRCIDPASGIVVKITRTES
jgi:uncharacterized repeat protein (TIGR04076 family)